MRGTALTRDRAVEKKTAGRFPPKGPREFTGRSEAGKGATAREKGFFFQTTQWLEESIFGIHKPNSKNKKPRLFPGRAF